MASSNNGNTQWYQPVAGLNNVGSYQVSSIPWVSSSAPAPVNTSPATELSFPTVTRFLTVKNLGSAAMRVGFSSAGVANTGTNYYVLASAESISLDVKVTKLYLLSNTTSPTSASVVAGLTGIPADQLPTSWSGSVGVG